MNERKAHFDSSKQVFEVMGTIREEKKKRAKRIGIFGSRLRKDHFEGESDVDLFIETENAAEEGDYVYKNGVTDINIVRAKPRITTKDNEINARTLRNIRRKTRWLWKK